MIKVFALQPEVLLEGSVIQRLEQFGFDQGRIIGRVPEGWRRLIGDAFKNADPSIKKQLELQLFRLHNARALQPLPQNDANSSWISSATNVSSEYLHGIIVKDRGGLSDDRILDLSDHFGGSEVWNVTTNVLSGRDARSMASQVSGLMRYAYVIKFVDHYLSSERRHIDFIEQSLKYRSNSPLRAKLNVEFHFGWKRRRPGDDYATLQLQSRSFFDSLVQSTRLALSDLLRQNDEVTWCQWTEKEDQDHQRFHERYVLTDLGGVEFGGGLDTGNPSQHTSVNLLSKSTVDTLNKRFSKTGIEFELLHSDEFKKGES
jgi:hypothetical protein